MITVYYEIKKRSDPDGSLRIRDIHDLVRDAKTGYALQRLQDIGMISRERGDTPWEKIYRILLPAELPLTAMKVAKLFGVTPDTVRSWTLNGLVTAEFSEPQKRHLYRQAELRKLTKVKLLATERKERARKKIEV